MSWLSGRSNAKVAAEREQEQEQSFSDRDANPVNDDAPYDEGVHSAVDPNQPNPVDDDAPFDDGVNTDASNPNA
jgi:hypothetical protein